MMDTQDPMKMNKTDYARWSIAVEQAVEIIERIKEDFNLSDTEALQFLKDRGTSHLLNDMALLFTSISDTEDETYRIFLGELPYGDVGKKDE